MRAFSSREERERRTNDIACEKGIQKKERKQTSERGFILPASSPSFPLFFPRVVRSEWCVIDNVRFLEREAGVLFDTRFLIVNEFDAGC